MLIRNPLILLYKIYRKGAARLERLGIEVTHPALYLISGKIVNHLIVLCVAALIIAGNLHARSADSDALIPHNILASVVIRNEDYEIEESLLTATDVTYSEIDALRSSTPVEKEETHLGTVPGDVALSPGALIKPILPDIEKRQEAPQSIHTYAVAEGDTLGTIARRSGLRMETLLWANNLKDTATLRIGQKIVVPPTDGVIYSVRRGDTLGAIARTYKADPDKIRSFNNISGDKLAIGKTIIIPGGSRPNSVAQPQTLIGRIKNIITPEPLKRIKDIATRLVWPTSARRITQYFNWRHTGVDIAGPPSNSIVAANDGVIVFAGWARGYGLSVLVDHGGGLTTRYGHSRQLLVKVGDRVARGERIAMVGSTGRSTGPHLHFEVMVNGRRVNPLSYIR